MTPGVERARRVGIVVALVAAGLLAAGAIVPRWWTGNAHGVDEGVGLRGVELCAREGCSSRGLGDLGSGSKSWPLLGATGFAVSWVAAAFLVAAVVMSARRIAPAWRVRVARAAAAFSLFALVVGVAFVATYPGFSGLGIGWALVAYHLGAVLGTGTGAMLLARSP
ncbi:MAG TPA: hypothetical protein VMZ28_26635 [Kofleriaceae bacterium]|nr:hypothetical protein [Kofleriaceae bacterium]